MKLDFGSLAFGYRVISGGNTPNWATALGQGKDHKINNTPEIDELIKGIMYSSVSPNYISTKIGKGGSIVYGNEHNSPIVIGSVFSKVFANDIRINDSKFVLIITRDTSASHEGRLRIKYGPKNTYSINGKEYTNQLFFNQLKTQLNLADDACWFVSDITIRNQDELVLTTHIVNADGIMEYADRDEIHNAWEELSPTDFNVKRWEKRMAENLLFYGVPGCGKSRKIKDDYCDDDEHMERVVFHPDYTYSDFVGQIVPKVVKSDDGNKSVTYKFEAGPFTRILEKAEHNDGDYYLVIEEINRGNAPAIFGDIFQLLDRNENGESEYGISNEDIADYVYGDKEKKVRIPSNLSILATMNTSDQNVFTLDTAFKRRWSMKRIENNVAACKFGNHRICNSSVSWSTFALKINDFIIDVTTENLSNEDNRLGAYFVKESELDDADKFGEKVLMYLWNDAFKYDHEKIFKSNYRTLDDLINGFKKVGFDIFVDQELFETKVDFNIVVGGNEVEVDQYLEGKKEHIIAYYSSLKEKIINNIPGMRESTTPSKQYIAWRSDNISKSSFVDIQLLSNSMVLFLEKPTDDKYLVVGEEIEHDNHHNHYFKVIYDESLIDDIAAVVIQSYKQLLKQGGVDA